MDYIEQGYSTWSCEKMNQSEFTTLVKDAFEKQGYSKIKVHTALFSKHADVFAHDRKGKKREFTADLITKRGKTLLQIKPKDSLEWIDRIEEYEAFMD